jgi:hypothetical protein
MIRIEPASLGGFTFIPGSTCRGGEITPSAWSSFRLRLSESLGEGSLLDAPGRAWDASRGLLQGANRPRTIAAISATRRDEDMRVFRGRPIDTANLFGLFIHSHPNASYERNVPPNGLREGWPILAADGRAISSFDLTLRIVQPLGWRKFRDSDSHGSR